MFPLYPCTEILSDLLSVIHHRLLSIYYQDAVVVRFAITPAQSTQTKLPNLCALHPMDWIW